MDYLIEVVIRYLKSRKDQLGWEHHAFIILDNCSCHTSQKVADECENQNIILIFIPPHSSHLLQPLDIDFLESINLPNHEYSCPEI